VPSEDPYQPLAAATVAKIADFTPQRLRTVLWAIGSLEYHNPVLVSALGEQVQRFAATGTATPALLASAWLTGACVKAEVAGLLLPAVKALVEGKEEFSPGELVELLRGSSKLNFDQKKLIMQAMRNRQPEEREVRSQRGKRRRAQSLEAAAAAEQQQQQGQGGGFGVHMWCKAIAEQMVEKVLYLSPGDLATVAIYWLVHGPELMAHEGVRGTQEQLFGAVAQQVQQRTAAFTSRDAAAIGSTFAALGFKQGLPALEALQAELEGHRGGFGGAEALGGAASGEGEQGDQGRGAAAAYLRDLTRDIAKLKKKS
jgi:hypothetical protein